jgi:hypothetical protein
MGLAAPVARLSLKIATLLLAAVGGLPRAAPLEYK